MEKNCLMHNKATFIIHFYSSFCYVGLHKIIALLQIICVPLFATVILHIIYNQRFFSKIITCSFFNICHKYLIVLIYGNIFGNFRALILLSTTLICLAIEVCQVLMSCCPLPDFIFLLIVACICSEFLCVGFFSFHLLF